jgi:enterochelin esterase family protein
MRPARGAAAGPGKSGAAAPQDAATTAPSAHTAAPPVERWVARRPLAIHTLLETRPLEPAAIDSFLTAHSVPIVEGTSVTFLFRGDAEAVHLRHFIYGLQSTQSFARLPDSDLWYLVLEIPPASRFEYKLEVVRNGHGQWIEDPLNPHKTSDPFGTNSVCRTSGYVVPDWTEPDPEARPGMLDEIRIPSRALHREARVTLYLPARFRRTRRYPLLVVHDGGDYLAYARLKTVLDNLVHRLDVAEVVAALLHPGDRLIEYANDVAHARFLTRELVPELETRLPLLGTPASRCLMGASFGAVASLSTAWRYPAFYGRLLLQSGSFAFTDIGPQKRGPAFEPVVQFVNAFRAQPLKISERVFMSCGTYESLIYENRSIVPILQSTGMAVRYVEARDGHNWENWRDRLRDGLAWLLPGPLWMVYE